MTLVEVVATVLGPSIAKAILKKWLNDSKIASDLTSSLIDLIKSRTSDYLTQNRLARQFEAIGERVAETLSGLFEAEGVNIPENGRVAVALAIAATLDKSGIDSALLAEKNLEPRLLAAYLTKSNPKATRDFSEPEKALYERSIQEASQYIVDIAAQLPQFNERTFHELLKRQNQLQDVADQILTEVSRIREDTVQSDHESAVFEVEYRRAVIRHLDELQLFGVDASLASRRHKLSVAYVTLSASQLGGGPTEVSNISSIVEGGDPKSIVKPNLVQKSDGEEGTPVDKVLQAFERLLIIGEAGSGKTTLLQWVAVRAAQRDFPQDLSNWNDLTPFFIRLRQCVDAGLPPPEQFPRFVAPAVAGSMPPGWVHDRLRRGSALVLIDGLDELGESLRKEVGAWLKDLAETYPAARFVVSSRPYAVGQGWLEDNGFREAELLPMELPDITSFIDHWHAAVRDELQVETERAELDDLAENLKQIVRKSIQLRKLATNPLLCAMLCALHRDRQRKLPSDRIELYEACFRMLVDRRDVERGVDLSDYPSLGYRQKRALLQDFAYWLLKNGYSMVDMEHADSRFRQKLDVLEGVKKAATGESVRRLFIQRSGILREPIKGQIDFTHRTFQEFLGAQAALDDGDLGLLIRNADQQDWREVVVLAAGLARAREREQIIKDLIARGDNEPRLRHQLHLLAVASLETSIELPVELKTEVSKRLRKLVPPKNLTEAKALASAGELALPFLASRYRKANITAACIRTLSLIGGDEALRILEDYYPDHRIAVSAELTKAWDYFDRNEYSNRLFTKSNSLHLIRPSSLEGVESLQDIEYLTVSQATKVITFTPILSLRKLERLIGIYLYNITKLPVMTFDKLEYLYLWGVRTEDITFLGELKAITEVVLGDFPRVADLGPMSRLQSMTALRLYHFPAVQNLTPLRNLNKLTSLLVNHCSTLVDITAIAELKELKTLDLEDCRGICDLTGISNLASLEKLLLSRCTNITDVTPLATLPNLKTLNLSKCASISDITPLAALQNLRWLNIQGTEAAHKELPGSFSKEFKPRLAIIK